MTLSLRPLMRGIRALLNRREADRAFDAEVDHYIDEAVRAYMAEGLDAEAARRAALLDVRGTLNVREQMRSSGWDHVLGTFIADVRYALRRLRNEPGFSFVAVFTLALGVGSAATIFSAAKPMLFDPLPYPVADRITAIHEVGADGSRNDGTFGMYRALATRTNTFDALAAYRPWTPTHVTRESAERLYGERVSADWFDVYGVRPSLGLPFDEQDDRLGGRNVVVLSDGLWRERFNAAASAIGREIVLDDVPHVIVGIMPASFDDVLSPGAQLWAPLQYDMSQGRAWGHHLRLIGRLRRGIEPATAARELDALGAMVIAEQQPATYGPQVRFDVAELRTDITRGVRGALFAIVGAVGLLLVIACVNVANLLLVRSARRQGEFAVRAALGAGGSRLARQVLTESIVIALLAGIAGMMIAAFGIRLLVAMSPPGVPRLDAIDVDFGVFVFAIAITTVCGIAFGMAPARRAMRNRTGGLLHGVTSRVVSSRGRLRSALVIGEVALALLLLMGAGLLMRSMQLLLDVNAGFDATHTLTMQVNGRGQHVSSAAATHLYFDEVLAAVRAVPGVEAAAFTSQLPVSGDADMYGVRFDPAFENDPGEVRGTFRYAVSSGYLETMGVPLRAGRFFDERDRAGAPLVALVSESFARRRLAGADPIGMRVRIGASDSPPFTVVGVAADVRQLSLAVSDAEAVYVPAEQWHFADEVRSIVVRTDADPAAFASRVRQAIQSVDRYQPITRVATMSNLVSASAAERRFTLLIFQAFALAALILVAAGVYGVTATDVGERRREFALRSAIGATPVDLLRLALRHGIVLAIIGTIIGVAVSAVSGRVLQTLLFDVSPHDAPTYVGVIVILVLVALAACAVPAMRAARTAPVQSLNIE